MTLKTTCAALLFCLLLAVAPAPVYAAEQTLSGHVPKLKAPLTAAGQLDASARLNLAIGLPLRNRDGLTNRLRELYDPASQNFHKFLTPEEFAEQFGPDEADYRAVIEFAESNHLQVVATHPNRLLLEVNGSVADIERALHVQMLRYRHPTEKRMFYAPDREPSLQLSVPVLHVSGLDNYFAPRPLYSRKTPRPSQTGITPAAGSGPNGTYMGNDFRAAYVPGTSLNGSGQVVGLLEFDGYFTNDITAYEIQAGLTNVPLKNVLLDGFDGVPGSANVEVSLDIDMAISMAPALAAVIIYEGQTTDSILNRMATDDLAKQLSASWTYSIDPVSEQIFQQFAAQGQSFFNASGDSDAWVSGIATPADDPYITVVGGTTLSTSGPGGARISETVWNWGDGIGSGGGISTRYSIPSWQQGLNMTANQGSTTMRNIPDVALTADNVYVVANGGQSGSVGGTSCATPLWAGFIALVNQQAAANGKPTVGFINPMVYAVGQSANYTYAFNDITTGNNTNSYSPTNYYAVLGYDLCTGWGTPNGTNLINTFVPPDALQITPVAGFAAGGRPGGPFNSTTRNFVLTNAGNASLNWALGTGAAWLNATPTSGSLTPGGPAMTVTATLNASASNQLVGVYATALRFTNQNDRVVQSRPFTLTVMKPPAILVAPTNQAVLGGAPVAFTVSAAGGLPLTYQWQQNGNNLTDANAVSGWQGSTLTISNVSLVNTGAYVVVIGNVAGVVTSSPPAQLTIIPSTPVIVTQPTGGSVLFGAPLHLSVTALGTAPLAYQWQMDSTNLIDDADISGATTANLTINSATSTTAGTYSVVVSNALGSTPSSGAVVSVYARSDTEFVANGGFETGDFSDWTESGNFTLTAVNNDGAFAHTGDFGAMCGPEGSLGYLSQAVATTPGTTYLLSLWLDSPDGLGPNEFQVMWNGNAIFDAVNLPAIGWTNLQIFVAATDTNTSLEFGFRDDATFLGLDDISLKPLLSPSGAPVITVQPPGQMVVVAGTTVVIPVTVAGMLPLSYQWQSNGLGMPGSVGAPLTLPNVSTNQAGRYNVIITNALGVAVSSNTVLSVLSGSPALITFDDLPGLGDAVPTGYNNLSWGNFYDINGLTYPLSGYHAGMVSPYNVVYNSYGEPAFLSSSTGSFSLLSAYVTAAWNDSLKLEVKGFSGSSLVYDQSFTLSATNPAFINFNCVQVTSIEFISSGGTPHPGYAGMGTHFVMDNLTVITTSPPHLDALYAFGGPDGGLPSAPLLQAADGSFYGTTEYGGGNNYGTIFRLTTNGMTTLVSFNYANGAYPQSGLVTGSDGALYGTTEAGGSLGYGTIFKMTPSGALTTLLSFNNTNGAYPYAALVSGGDGNFYGTTEDGGASSEGTVFKVTTNGSLTTLVSFNDTNGANPYAPLLLGSDGNFYGTTAYGGTNYGTVFELTTNGNLTTLVAFNFANGAYPHGSLVQDANGNFYGTTVNGGSNYVGTVFRLATNGLLISLIAFSGSDSAHPNSALVQDAEGNLYGTTESGGLGGEGALFKLAPDGTSSVYAVFAGTNGTTPLAGLTLGSDGNLYGTASAGGLGYSGSATSGDGTVFRLDVQVPALTPPTITTQPAVQIVAAGGSATFSVNALSSAPLAYSWRRNGVPIAGATQSSFTTNQVQLAIDGSRFSCLVSNVYGTAMSSNALLAVLPPGASGPIHEFNGVDGGLASAALMRAADGLCYGTTEYGGTNGEGSVFSLSTNGSVNTLFSFNNANGAQPQAGLLQTPDGSFYGTTAKGGIYGYGTVFRLSTNGLTTLVSFTQANGASPQAGLVMGTDGNLYGTTSSGGLGNQGTVFRMTTSGTLTTLVSFSGSNGAYPYAGLVPGADGSLYGTTTQGGTNLYGTLFKITTNGFFTSLFSFALNEGAYPYAALVQGTDGNLYGTTEYGGTNYEGTLFQMTTNGSFTTLVTFNYANGANPYGGLLQADNGDFYGTTAYGGNYGRGSVFRWNSDGLTNLYVFTGTNGMEPRSTLALGADGSLFGTAAYGGVGYDGRYDSGNGTIFRVSIPVSACAPAITAQPQALTVVPGGTASFCVTATGCAPLHYFWQRNGAPIPGAGGACYATNPVQLADSGSQFSCLVSNASGTVLSSNALLTVSANLIQNGGFETGDLTGWAGSHLGAYVSSLASYVHSGSYGAQLGPAGALGYLAQSVATTAGSNYLVSLWVDNLGGTPNEFQVAWNGTNLFDKVNLPIFAWTNLQFVVSAASNGSTLQFGFRQDPSYFGLDDVNVIPYVVLPSITRVTLDRTGGFQINLSGSSGEIFRILGSTNLVTWQTVATLTNVTGTVEFEDPAATSLNRRFYRLVTP